MTKHIAIFASGSGSNAENIIRYFSNSSNVEVSLLICNKHNAYVLERVKKFDIETQIITREDFQKSEYVLSILKNKHIDFIVLAGFLLQIPLYIIESYPESIINIHPALLPRFGGKGMYGNNVHRAVIDAGETQTGITIHYINEHYDEGECISQYTCPVFPDDTPETVAARVHELEYKYYPQTIDLLLSSRNLET